MRPVKCDLCGADDYTVVFEKGVAQLHRIVRCNRCQLMYANPQELVDCERMPQNYQYEPDGKDRLYFQKQLTQLPDNEAALHVLNQLCPQRGRLLEIGSFVGVFAHRIKEDGWDFTGLEPFVPAAEYARRTYGLDLITGLLPCPELKAATFDAVVMLHVIEHMPAPSEDLREIRRLLKPGGVLVVETPRFDSLMFKLLGRRERSLGNCNGHIYFFTTHTLRRLLEKSGFEVLRTDLVGRTLTLDRLVYNLGVIARNDRFHLALARVSRVLRLEKFRMHINVHDMQRMYARAR